MNKFKIKKIGVNHWLNDVYTTKLGTIIVDLYSNPNNPCLFTIKDNSNWDSDIDFKVSSVLFEIVNDFN